MTIADLEDRFSSEDPSISKLKSILLQRIADLERDEDLEFPDVTALRLRAL